MIQITVKKTNAYTKIRGLIGNKSEPILLQTRFGIHTFGVKFPIDVVIMDKHNIVRVLKKALKPNSLFFWPIRYDRVLELPEGMIEEKGIKPKVKLHLLLSKD